MCLQPQYFNMYKRKIPNNSCQCVPIATNLSTNTDSTHRRLQQCVGSRDQSLPAVTSLLRSIPIQPIKSFPPSRALRSGPHSSMPPSHTQRSGPHTSIPPSHLTHTGLTYNRPLAQARVTARPWALFTVGKKMSRDIYKEKSGFVTQRV